MESPLIQQSTDYSLFSVIVGNRPINEKKVSKLVADIQNGFNMLPYVPSIVNTLPAGKFGIIDGQHRIEAAKRTENPVYYVVADNLTLKQIANLNSRSERWKPQDFLNCYVNLGSEDYKTLKKFVAKFPINLMAAAELLMYNNPKVGGAYDTKEVFESGEFKVNYMNEATRLCELAKDIFSLYKFSHDRYLLQALQQLQEKGLCNIDRLILKISAAPNMMDKQPDKKKYLDNIERVYNFKAHTRETIY